MHYIQSSHSSYEVCSTAPTKSVKIHATQARKGQSKHFRTKSNERDYGLGVEKNHGLGEKTKCISTYRESMTVFHQCVSPLLGSNFPTDIQDQILLCLGAVFSHISGLDKPGSHNQMFLHIGANTTLVAKLTP